MALVGVGLAAALGFSLSWSAAVCRALGYRHGWQGTLLTLLMLLSPLALILATAAGVLACAGSPSGAPWGYAHWLALGAIPLIVLVLSFRAWRAAGRVLREKREAA